MRTLFLHIGTPKTGTSSLQQFLAKNSDILQQYGYCYPDMEKQKYENVKRVRNGHFLVGRVWNENRERQREKEQELFWDGMEQLEKLFDQYENIILSDEHIWWGTSLHRKGLWKRLKKFGEKCNVQIKIIVYLRRQDDYVSSHWNQFVKNNVNTRTWDEQVEYFLSHEKMRVQYATKLDSIAKVMGKENIVVRRFDWDYFVGGTIYEDFLQVVGLRYTSDYVIPEVPENNIGLKGNYFEIKRVLNRMPELSEDMLRKFGGFLKSCSAHYSGEYKYHMFSWQERKDFMELFSEENDRVAQEYINDGEDLFPEKEKVLPKWRPDNEFMYQDLICFMATVHSDLYEKQLKMQEEIQRLKQKKTLTEKVYTKVKTTIQRG